MLVERLISELEKHKGKNFDFIKFEDEYRSSAEYFEFDYIIELQDCNDNDVIKIAIK